MKYIVTKRVSIISLSTKMADSWDKPRGADNSKFLLHAAFEESNLIQSADGVLNAHQGPPEEHVSQICLKNCFPVVLAASASLYQCQVSIVVRKKT